MIGIDTNSMFLTWMRDFDLGRKHLLDTLLAASLYRAGLRRVTTSNWRDFARYQVFELLPSEPA